MKDNEMMKLRSIKFFSSPRVHSFLFFILDGAWVVWEVFPLYPSCRHLQSEQVEVEGIDMMKVAEHDHLMDHRLEDGGMNMMEEHYHPMNHWVEEEDMDMVEERPSNHRLEVEGIDREDSDMGKDMTVEMEVVEREHEGMVLVRHWTSDGAVRYWWARQEWEELAKSGCSEGHTTFANRNFNCSTWRRV
jgi:hypothetical protein